MLSPLPLRSSSARETHAALRAAILAGALEPDVRLYESRIAAELGVSRTPVREALAMLEAEELIVSMPNRGTVVRRVTPDEVRETYDVRAVVEGFGARLAAARLRKQELSRLRRLHGEMERVLSGSSPEEVVVRRVAEVNAEFHRTIAAAAGNRVLERTVAGLIETPLYARAYFWFTEELRWGSLRDHAQMIELLAAGDGDACESFWQRHLVRGREQLIEHLQASAEVGH